MLIQFLNGDTIEHVRFLAFGFNKEGKLVIFVDGKLQIFVEDISIIQVE